MPTSESSQTEWLRPGAEVIERNSGRHGVVLTGPRTMRGASQWQVRWTSGPGGARWVDANQLEPLAVETAGWAVADDFLADFALAKFLYDFADVLMSIGSSRTQFLVYQYKPVLQFVQQNPHGLLIADEVGLGKTIEAALILREMLARGAVHRVLVVCPANLRAKWRDELSRRFSIELTDLRAAQFRQMRSEFEQRGTWPRFFGVTSLEGLRREDVMDALQETGLTFDLVIVDEAHHLRNPSTRSYELGDMLSGVADHVLLLSATPIQTGESDLLSLLRLIAPDEFASETLDDLDERLAPNAHLNVALRELGRADAEPRRVAAALRDTLGTPYGSGFTGDALFMSWVNQLEDRSELSAEETVRLRRDLQRRHSLAPYYTRTRKREVQETAERRAQTIEVPLSEEEGAFYNAWVEFLIALHAEKRPGVHPGFWTVQRERQAASSLHAARDRVEELVAQAGLEGEFEGEDSDNASEPDDVLRPVASSALQSVIERVRLAAAELPARDSKVEHLISMIRELQRARPGRKMLIFTFFVSTLQHLERALSAAGIATRSISGAVRPDQRPKVVDEFRRDPSQSVLLSTEVGSEGLDFQFCDVVINYDLPWNPMRVEQRIGRIDRFGQKAKEVIVASLFVEGTIDTRVLRRLYNRIQVFEEAIGAVEPILGPVIQKLQRQALGGGFSDSELEQRAHEEGLRLETLKQETEDFEDQRAALLGHGDMLIHDIEEIRRSGRYVSPAEVRALISRWLRRENPDDKGLIRTDLGGVYQLHASGAAVNRVRTWMLENDVGVEHDLFFDEMDRLGYAAVTFEEDVALSRDWLPLLHSGHPLIQYVVTHLNREDPRLWLTRMGSFAMPQHIPDRVLRGPVALAVYSLEMNDIERRETLMPIAYAIDVDEECPELADSLLGALQGAVDVEPPTWLDEQRARELEEATDKLAYDRKRRNEQAAREQQSTRVAVQRAQISRSYDARIARQHELRGRATNERIIRMHEGRIRNLESEKNERLSELDRASPPVAQVELLSMAIFL